MKPAWTSGSRPFAVTNRRSRTRPPTTDPSGNGFSRFPAVVSARIEHRERSADELPATVPAPVRPRRVEGQALPVAPQACRAGVGGRGLWRARRHLPALRGQAGCLRRRGGPADLGDHARPRRPRRHRRMVDRADRLPEGGRVDDALGDPRSRLGLDGARRSLHAAYRLRPGTVRLAPWPDEVPLTGGTRRTLADVALYVGVLGAAVYLLFSDGESFAGTAAGRLDPTAIAVLLGLLVLLGLRDKVSFLSARPEVYGFLLVVSLFPVENFIVGWQFVFFFIWWGAASSKFNRHFPFVIAVMSSNTPWNRSHNAKAKMYVNYPDDIRPSGSAALMAHLGHAIALGLPLVLLLTAGGPIALIALIGMIIFHANITSTFALGVPLEWNLFMIFGLLFLFGEYGDVPLSTLDDPLLIIVLGVIGVLIPVAGNLRPDKVSFLPGMRYYAGNWATSLWLFRKDTAAEDKLDREICRVAPVVVEQLAKLYGDETAEYLMAKGVAFRAMHSHGRALLGLLPRAVDDVDRYHVREGELVSGVVNGWNFGDGHFHNEQLLEAVQERCGFEEGDLRVVVLESQPAHVQRQRYRICDAASGLVEEGWVEVADMLERGPWLEESWDFPVEVTRRGGDRSAHPAIA